MTYFTVHISLGLRRKSNRGRRVLVNPLVGFKRQGRFSFVFNSHSLKHSYLDCHRTPWLFVYGVSLCRIWSLTLICLDIYESPIGIPVYVVDSWSKTSRTTNRGRIGRVRFIDLWIYSVTPLFHFLPPLGIYLCKRGLHWLLSYTIRQKESPFWPHPLNIVVSTQCLYRQKTRGF